MNFLQVISKAVIMASPLIRLSHISLQVSSSQKIITDLVTKYQFRPLAARGLDGRARRQTVLGNGRVVFIVNENSPEVPRNCSLLYDSPLPSPFPDTACNVSYEVEDVPGLCRFLTKEGCHLLVPPTELHDYAGSVSYCVVKSVLGNVNHTLIDRTRYAAPFLPGFQLLENDPVATGDLSHVDHITYCLPRGTMPRVIEWYRRCFGFQHFPLSKEEDPKHGLEISGSQIGLRLLSMECPGQTEVGKIVMVESLPQQGINQIDQFLQHHQAGGIQHIGLSTRDIFKAVGSWTEHGVHFAAQPPSYYTDPHKQAEILHAGLIPQQLCPFGILLDSSTENQELTATNKKVLLQVFTEPLFSKDSVYLELIERRGAQGFGEGNIRALWRSMQDMMDELSCKEQEEALTQ
ncbi:4-hydroxyphenylpyruvate dioxygenase-like protein [Pseudophryne corroboree]|uniref:4-hydroxyphenylpyruvate dioxygenase-like protein n=1 Tax=Pseudophryne corroboree TaxID=495146 RepID=UPI0030817B63